MRYIELNPVRANMIAHPGEYEWSSYRSNACLEYNKIVSHHEIYMSLGTNELERTQAY